MELQDKYTSLVPVSNDSEDVGDDGISGMPYVLADFDVLRQINPETMGWLAIPNTGVSFPVLHSVDNDKYLNTSFYGEKSNTGAIFLDCSNKVDPLDKNSILYGHNMGRGRVGDMFGPLLKFKEKSYYEEHNHIQFDTVHRRYGWWKVFAVVNLDVKTSTFDYLKQNFSDAAEFEAWIAQAKQLSLYDAGVQVMPGDRTLVLSTCDRFFSKNGRLLVMAVHTEGGI